MELDKLLVIILGIGGIAFTYWFFLMKRENVVIAHDAIAITVSGGYSPENIAVPKGKTTKITFIRTDPNTCLEEVVLSDFRIRKYLPLNKRVEVEIAPEKEGEYPFSCGMNMFHGKIIVKGKG